MKSFLAILLAALLLVGCAAAEVNVCVLTGPTGIGAVNMWEKDGYAFTVADSPDEAVAKLVSGEVDVAAIATNLAAKLYRKTQGGVRLLAVNTLGVLSALELSGSEITTIADLKEHKLVTTGQGANPQYILEYLLRQNGVDPDADVAIDYRADVSELASVWATEPEAVIVAPCPVSTMILQKYEGARKALDLTEEWERCSPDSELMMGCVVARADFCAERPEALEAFLADYEASIGMTAEDPRRTGELCEKYGIVAKAAVAVKALPDCHLCFVTGEALRKGLTGYLEVLYEADPEAVGALPDEGFWYAG